MYNTFLYRYYDARISRWLNTDPALQEGKYFSKPNDYDTEHDFYWYLQQDGSRKLPGLGGVFNAVNLDVYHYAGQSPVKLVDPDGEAALPGAIFGLIGGVAAEVTLQATSNLLSGKGALDDLDYSDIIISGLVGAGTGAAGVGVLTQGKKLVDAYKTYKVANAALKARQIAIAAGKVRNTKKTAKVLQRVNENKKMIIKSFAKGSAGVVLKNILKESVNIVQDKKKEK